MNSKPHKGVIHRISKYLFEHKVLCNYIAVSMHNDGTIRIRPNRNSGGIGWDFETDLVENNILINGIILIGFMF